MSIRLASTRETVHASIANSTALRQNDADALAPCPQLPDQVLYCLRLTEEIPVMRCKIVAALVGFSLAVPGVALAADQPPLSEQLINAMNKVWGVHAGLRANHAKGIVAEGHFKASPEAAELSRAAQFGGATIPVTVPFS